MTSLSESQVKFSALAKLAAVHHQVEVLPQGGHAAEQFPELRAVQDQEERAGFIRNRRSVADAGFEQAAFAEVIARVERGNVNRFVLLVAKPGARARDKSCRTNPPGRLR